MKIKTALEYGRSTLAVSHVIDSRLEAEVLLRYALNVDRVRLYLDMGRELDTNEYDTFLQLIERRRKGEPSAYITGHREFFGLDFFIDNRALIPRPETEMLVETALAVAANRSVPLIADIGTGSGAVAVSLASRLPKAIIFATDISSRALEVAAENTRRYGVTGRVRLLQGDLLTPVPKPVDMVVANLPYVMKSELRQVNTWGYEPTLALDGGEDGLDLFRRLTRQSKSKLKADGVLLMEVGAGQGDTVIELLEETFPGAQLTLISDTAGIDRVVSTVLRD